MTNATNVVFVTDTLLSHLKLTTDVPFRMGLVERLTQLAERFAPDNNWYIRTMNAVFELGGELVRPDVAHNLMRLIAEGSGEDEDADMALRKYAATQYYALLAKPMLPDTLMQVVCWVIGEYGYLCTDASPLDIVERLCDAVERQFSQPGTRCWVVSALCKLVAQLGKLPEQVVEVAGKFVTSSDLALSRYCVELSALSEHMGLMKDALPVDASCEDLETDGSLSFLDSFVAHAIAQGAQPYVPKGQRHDELDAEGMVARRVANSNASSMRFAEYEKAEAPRVNDTRLAEGMQPKVAAMEQQETADSSLGSGLNVSGVVQKWGADGFMASGKNQQPAPTPTSMPAPSPGAMSSAPPIASAGAGIRGLADAPTAPKELTEREKKAAALFGGISGAPPAVPAGSMQPAASAASADAPPLPPREKTSKKKGNAVVSGSSGGDVDLLGGLFDTSASGQGVAAPLACAMATSAAPRGADSDLLSLMDDGPSAPPPQQSDLMGSAAANVGIAASRPAPLSAYQLMSDACVRVLTDAAAGTGSGDAIEIKLYIEPTVGALRNLSVQLECPPSLQISLRAPPPAVVSGPRVQLPMLSPGGAATINVLVACAAALVTVPETKLLGQLSYFDASSVMEPRILSFHIPFNLRALLRPCPIATADFGAMWGTHAAESKAMGQFSCSAEPPVFMNLLERSLHISPVQTIGMECIACGKIVGSDLTVLVHGKLGLMNGRALELTLRTKDPRLSDALLRVISEVLQVGA